MFEGKVPSDWDDSFIISLYKGKGEALERGNYRDLKLTDQVLKVVERIIEKRIQEIIDTDSMQFRFMPGCGTTDAIFIVRQLQEKYLAKKKNLYFAFVDLEKAFDRVPCIVLWWAMRVVELTPRLWKTSVERDLPVWGQPGLQLRHGPQIV